MVIAKGEPVSLSDYPQNLQMVKCPKDMLHIAIDLNYGYFIDFLKENLRSTQKGLTMFLGGNIIVNYPYQEKQRIHYLYFYTMSSHSR